MFNPMINVVGTTMYLFWLFPYSQPTLTAYDCTKGVSKFGYYHDYNIFPWCETLSTSRTIQGELVRRAPRKPIKAYHCYVSFAQWKVNSQGSRQHTVSNESQIIGRDACLQAHSSKSIVLHGQRILIPLLDGNGTVEHTVTNITRLARGYHYERTYQINLSMKQGDVDFKRDIVRFGSIACDFSQLECEDPNLSGELYWKSERDGKKKLYSGVIQLVTRDETTTRGDSGKTVTYPEVSYAVFRGNRKVFVLKTLWNETQDGITEVQTEVDDLCILAYQRAPQPLEIDSNFKIHAATELHNVYTEAPGSEEFDAVEVVKGLCREEELDFFLRLRSAPLDIAIDLPQKGCMFYKIRDGEYKLETCLKTKVRLWSTNQSYLGILVKDSDGEAWFMDPFSRILKNITTAKINSQQEIKNTETSCSKVIPPIITNRNNNIVTWIFIFMSAMIVSTVIWLSCCLRNDESDDWFQEEFQSMTQEKIVV